MEVAVVWSEKQGYKLSGFKLEAYLLLAQSFCFIVGGFFGSENMFWISLPPTFLHQSVFISLEDLPLLITK